MIVANDVVASQMAGPGIRCVELAQQLARQGGHLVTLVTVGPTDLSHPAFETLAAPSTAQLLSHAALQDAVILEGISLARYPDLRRARVPLVFDLYDPFPLALLEQEAHLSLVQQRRESTAIRRVLREMLHSGDFFLCASEMQRDLWLGALLSEGRVNPDIWAGDNSLRQLVDVVPFGLPQEAPEPVADRRLPVAEFRRSDVVLVWGGGIYNWFDPLTLIRAIDQAQEPRLKLVFMATGHPNVSVPQRMWMPSRARELSDALHLTGRSVFFNTEWVAYAERGKWLATADVGVSTHFDHAETRYAYRTRMLDYLWAGLPILCSSGDHFANLVAQRRLGWVVAPEDVSGLTLALQELVASPAKRREMSLRVREVAAEMTWERVAGPLVEFCAQPRRAADSPRREWINRREPGPWELRARAGTRLARRASQELVRGGPRQTASKVVRWWRERRSI